MKTALTTGESAIPFFTSFWSIVMTVPHAWVTLHFTVRRQCTQRRTFGWRKRGLYLLLDVTLFFMSLWFLMVWGTPYEACVPHDIKGKNSAVGKLLSKHKRGSHFNLHSSCGSLFFNLWLDGAACLFANNDFDSNAMGTVTGQIHNKSKGEYHGRRSYQANEAIRCYRHVHNNVDIHNQFCAYGHWDYRTRKKQMRVPADIHICYVPVELQRWDWFCFIWFIRGGELLYRVA